MEVIIIALLIILNGIFSMSEIAIIYARKSSLNNEIRHGSKAAKIALNLSDNPDKFLSTVQIGITLIGIVTGIYSGDVIAASFARWLEGFGFSDSYSYAVAQVLIVVIVTYFSIIFGELVPKRIGMALSLKMAKLVAAPMHWISVIAFPFVWLLSKSTEFIFNLLNIHKANDKVTEEEIKSMIDEGAATGEVQPVEQDIVDRVFSLGSRTIQTIMTYKDEIEFLDISMSKQEIFNKITKHLHQVYPVTKDFSPEKVLGTVNIKELFGKFSDNAPFNLSDFIHKANYFHENTDVYKVLEYIRKHHIKYGIITDEFGSMQGIITLRDILEALIGTLPDNSEDIEIVPDGHNKWIVSGRCFFYDFLDYFDLDDLYPQYNYNTVSGLILGQLKHIPEKGETMKWEKFIFEILEMDGAKINKILVSLIPENKK